MRNKFIVIATALGFALITTSASASYTPVGDSVKVGGSVDTGASAATSGKSQLVRVAGGCYHPKYNPYGPRCGPRYGHRQHRRADPRALIENVLRGVHGRRSAKTGSFVRKTGSFTKKTGSFVKKTDSFTKKTGSFSKLQGCVVRNQRTGEVKTLPLEVCEAGTKTLSTRKVEQYGNGGEVVHYRN
jgi:hypothetical protein